MEKVRAYGAGDVRIGTKLVMDEDIYSLAFVSMLSDECITPHFNVITGELIEKSESKEEDKPRVVNNSPFDALRKKVNKEEKQDEFTLEL